MSAHIMPNNMGIMKNTSSQKTMFTKAPGLIVPGFNRTIPKHCPQLCSDVPLIECIECGDKFALKSSYDMHINRRSVNIRHDCKICRQTNVFHNTCQLLVHARKHEKYSVQLNQENINDIVVSPIAQSEFDMNSYPKDLVQTRQNFLYAGGSWMVPNIAADVPNSLPPSNVLENGPSITVPSTDAVNTISNTTNGLNTGLLILNPNQNLINPFSNHNFILTDSGIVAVPNMPTNLSSFQIQPVNNSSVTDSPVVASVPSTADTNSNCSTVSGISNLQTPVEKISEKVEPPEVKDVKKSGVFLKDIGTLLKSEVTTKTNSNPVIAWSSNGDRICVECNMHVKTCMSLKEHYMTPRVNKGPILCSTCSIQLPSKCALSSHMRTHTKLPPFICPDCAIRFSSYPQLNEHMKSVCFHLDKRSRQKCPLPDCTSKLFPHANAFMKHLATQHMKSIFKCNLCPIACFTQISLNTHMKDKHFGCVEMPSPYYQCGLCPDRLIPKSRLDQHIEEHAQNCNKINVYLCRQCNKFSLMRQDHLTHTLKCKGSPSPIHKGNKRPNDDSSDALRDMKKIKADAVQISEKSKVVNGESLLKKTVVTNCFDCKRELSCTFSGENEKSLPIRCPQCYKGTKAITKLPCPALVKIDGKPEKANEEKPVVVNTETPDANKINTSNESSKAEKIDDSDKDKGYALSIVSIKNPVVNRKICQSRKSCEIPQAKPLNSARKSCGDERSKSDSDKDVKLDRRFTVKRLTAEDKIKALNKTETAVASPSDPNELQCARCVFKISDRTEFGVHVKTHRDVNTAYQCMECGLSFMVKPSLQKHLMIRHSIMDVEEYIRDNKECVDKDAVKAALTSIIVGPIDDLKENQCRICKEQFDSPVEHDKHFRVHGMAFLKQKELDKITAET